MSVQRINEFHAAAGAEARLRHFLASVIALINGAPGCLACELLVDPTDAGRLAIIETWTSVEAHKAAASRVPSEMYAAFQPLVAEPPRGRYYTAVA